MPKIDHKYRSIVSSVLLDNLQDQLYSLFVPGIASTNPDELKASLTSQAKVTVADFTQGAWAYTDNTFVDSFYSREIDFTGKETGTYYIYLDVYKPQVSIDNPNPEYQAWAKAATTVDENVYLVIASIIWDGTGVSFLTDLRDGKFGVIAFAHPLFRGIAGSSDPARFVKVMNNLLVVNNAIIKFADGLKISGTSAPSNPDLSYLYANLKPIAFGRAWCYHPPGPFISGFNISGITREGVGIYIVSFDTTLGTTSAAIATSGWGESSTTPPIYFGVIVGCRLISGTQMEMRIYNVDGDLTDSATVGFVIYK